MRLRGLDFASLVLLIVGGINWGLIGLFNWKLVGGIFGYGWFARPIYIVVGAAAAYAANRSPNFTHLREPSPTPQP